MLILNATACTSYVAKHSLNVTVHIYVCMCLQLFSVLVGFIHICICKSSHSLVLHLVCNDACVYYVYTLYKEVHTALIDKLPCSLYMGGRGIQETTDFFQYKSYRTLEVPIVCPSPVPVIKNMCTTSAPRKIGCSEVNFGSIMLGYARFWYADSLLG